MDRVQPCKKLAGMRPLLRRIIKQVLEVEWWNLGTGRAAEDLGRIQLESSREIE